jgi:hypothetical protein
MTTPQYPTYISHEHGFADWPQRAAHDHLYLSVVELYEVEVGGSFWAAGSDEDTRCIVCGKYLPDEPDGAVLSCDWEEPPAGFDEE